MKLRKHFAASALAAALLFPLAAPAAAQTAPAVGAVVSDPQGGEVGRIDSVDGDYVVIRTDRHEARIPVASFTVTDNSVLFALTRDQLNAQMDQALAEAQQAFVVGAVVHDRDGAVIGPVEALDAETVTVKLGEQPIRLPRSAVAAGQNGLIIGATLADLQAQIGATASAGSN